MLPLLHSRSLIYDNHVLKLKTQLIQVSGVWYHMVVVGSIYKEQSRTMPSRRLLFYFFLLEKVSRDSCNHEHTQCRLDQGFKV